MFRLILFLWLGLFNFYISLLINDFFLKWAIFSFMFLLEVIKLSTPFFSNPWSVCKGSQGPKNLWLYFGSLLLLLGSTKLKNFPWLWSLTSLTKPLHFRYSNRRTFKYATALISKALPGLSMIFGAFVLAAKADTTAIILLSVLKTSTKLSAIVVLSLTALNFLLSQFEPWPFKKFRTWEVHQYHLWW